MYKLLKTAIVAIAVLTIISCATSDQVVHHDPVGCSPNNVVIKVELDQANSVPRLNDLSKYLPAHRVKPPILPRVISHQ